MATKKPPAYTDIQLFRGSERLAYMRFKGGTPDAGGEYRLDIEHLAETSAKGPRMEVANLRKADLLHLMYEIASTIYEEDQTDNIEKLHTAAVRAYAAVIAEAKQAEEKTV